MPRSVVEEFAPTGPARQLGIDSDTSRLVYATAEESIFVVRGGGHVCAVRATADLRSTACGPETKELAEVPITTAEVSDNGYRVWGVLPDGGRANAVSTNVGSKASVATRGGAFSIETKEPAALEWTAADGRPMTQTLKTLSSDSKN